MKKIFKPLWLLIFLILILVNVYIVGKGIRLSDEISRIERKMEDLKKENSFLETKLASFDSLEYVASVAADLNFIVKSEPYSFDSIKQAYKK